MSFIPIDHALAVPRQKQRKVGARRHCRLRIYALVDPCDSCIRYVGVTSRLLEDRLTLHLQKPTNAAMAAWMRELQRARKRPLVVLLEWVVEEEWEAAERGWIHWCRERGDLLNVDRGGRARTSLGKLRPFVEGQYEPPTSVGSARRPKISQDGPKTPGGGQTDRGSGLECRPRLVPVADGVFRRAKGLAPGPIRAAEALPTRIKA